MKSPSGIKSSPILIALLLVRCLLLPGTTVSQDPFQVQLSTSAQRKLVVDMSADEQPFQGDTINVFFSQESSL